MSDCTHGNGSDLGWVVQKFGGTSVGKFPDKIARDIIKETTTHQRVVVVCSARSTGKKAEGTTSRLLGVYSKLTRLRDVRGQKDTEDEQATLVEEAQGLVLAICNDHVAAAQTFVRDPARMAALEGKVRAECKELVDYLDAARRFKLDIDARAKDRVCSHGEKLSCLFMTALLEDHGVEAEYVDLSDCLHYAKPSDAPVLLDPSFYKAFVDAFMVKIKACGTRVPVVTGFFGNVPGSLIDGEIGRGYTDLCAGLCAVGLKAEELQIWKEVDGIFTADPSKVATASLLSSITPAEAAELTFYGSEVIHHLTMDQVIRAQPPVPIRIKNVKNPRGNGTVVIPDLDLSAGHQLHASRPSQVNLAVSGVSSAMTPRRPTAVTIKDHISIINVHSNKRSIAHGFFMKVFYVLNEHSISVDLIATSEVHVSMAIHSPGAQREAFAKAVKALEECGHVSVLPGMAILSLVGADMKNMVGISGKMFTTLGEYGINIEMISQGASEINISCVVHARSATRAMNVLHTHLFTFLD